MTREPLFLRTPSGCAPRFRFDPTTTRASKIASAITTSPRLIAAHIKCVAKATSNWILRGSALLLLRRATRLCGYGERKSVYGAQTEKGRGGEDEGEVETSSRPRSTPPLDAAFPRVH